MAKQIIRLTEGDLHKIIEESVNQILCELDPRTYAWAANQRQQQGNKNSAVQLRNKAAKTWTNQYGTKNGEYKHQENGSWKKREMLGNNGDGSYYVDDKEYMDKDFKHPENYTHQDTHTFYKDGRVLHHRDYLNNKGENIYDFKNMNGENFNTNDNGLKVAQQMANGKGKYVKGQGWQ